ncbi:MAG: aminoglycoside phosphotransferase family protein [Rhodobacteraceae bacterium]|nr:aminoglycoside phosphotransferase family protein [Paracoccaceae bacterium]
MNVLSQKAPSFLDAWQSPQTLAAVSEMLGTSPRRLELERTHFPGKRPVQLVLRAIMPDGKYRSILAEQCPNDPGEHADHARTSLSKSRNGQKLGLDDYAIQVVKGSDLILRRPGLDERLPGLRLLHDPAFARRTYQVLFARDPGAVAVDLVAHRLGKRAVLRMMSPDTVFYVRLRAIKSNEGQDRLVLHQKLWRCLAGQSGLSIPAPLGAMPEIGASFFGMLPGCPPDFGSSDSAAAARAISALQALEPPELPVHRGVDEARILSEWLQRCHRWRPKLGSKIAPMVAQVNAELKNVNRPFLPCHRDLHEKQILISDGVAGLLDFDTLCLSDPALDAGNLLAHLFFAGVDEAPLRSHLAESGITLWRRAALLRLAMIYAFTSTPTMALDRLIFEASNAKN